MFALLRERNTLYKWIGNDHGIYLAGIVRIEIMLFFFFCFFFLLLGLGVVVGGAGGVQFLTIEI